MIKKRGSKYVLVSHKGKKLAEGSRKQVVKRERQIEWFKSHPKAS